MGLGFTQHIEIDSRGSAAPAELATPDELQRHFAREVHDQLAQPLIALLLEIRELKTAADSAGAVTAGLGRLEDSARRILRQAREMMVDLRERSDLRVNLPQAMRDEIPVRPGAHLEVQVTSRWPKQVNGWAAFNLLRIVQQAAANAFRHGLATKVDVVLDVGPAGEGVVVVLDDGIGIDDASIGYGMAGMKERADILGGAMSAGRRDPGGTRVEVRFPLERLS